MVSQATAIYRRYNSTPDEAWKELLRRSAANPVIDDLHFPLLPDETTQRNFVGQTLLENVQLPYQYYKAVKDTYQSRINKIDEQTTLLDVGSGWGRIIRFFMKDIVPANIAGCDVSPQSIEICNSCFRGELSFQLIDPLPPSPYEDAHFDIIEGYSVFSHLSYQAAVLWMHEYFRILKPGGMLALTVWKPRRFDFIRKLQGEPPKSPESERYYSLLQSAFSRNCELEKELYRKIGFVFVPYAADAENTYGEAFYSPDALAHQWSSLFEYLTTVETEADQQIVFFQKKLDARAIDGKTLEETARVAKMFDIQTISVNSYLRKLSSEGVDIVRASLAEKEIQLMKSQEQLAQKTRLVEELLDSASWRVTGPLRRVHEMLLKVKRKSIA